MKSVNSTRKGYLTTHCLTITTHTMVMLSILIMYTNEEVKLETGYISAAL